MDVVESVIAFGGLYIMLRSIYKWYRFITKEKSTFKGNSFTWQMGYVAYILVGGAMIALGVLSAKGVIVVNWGASRETLFW